MIRVGWPPALAKARKRTQLVRVRRRPAPRRKPAPASAWSVRVDPATLTTFVDRPAAPLPAARLVRDAVATPTEALVGDALGWLAARAAWLRPRAIPMIVAFAGMLAVLASVSYLGNMNRGDGARPAHAQASSTNRITLEPAAAFTIRIR